MPDELMAFGGASSSATDRTATATFLFTDVEGSTRLLDGRERGYGAARERHDQILLRTAFAATAGAVSTPQGDSFFVAFADASAAVQRRCRAQRVLAATALARRDIACACGWGCTPGEATPTRRGYVGLAVHRAARIAAAAHGGQVLLSGRPPRSLGDEGTSRRNRAPRPRRPPAEGLPPSRPALPAGGRRAPSDFPPLRTWTRPGNRPPGCRRLVGRTGRGHAVRGSAPRGDAAGHGDRPGRHRQDAVGGGGAAATVAALRRAGRSS